MAYKEACRKRSRHQILKGKKKPSLVPTPGFFPKPSWQECGGRRSPHQLILSEATLGLPQGPQHVSPTACLPLDPGLLRLERLLGAPTVTSLLAVLRIRKKWPHILSTVGCLRTGAKISCVHRGSCVGKHTVSICKEPGRATS